MSYSLNSLLAKAVEISESNAKIDSALDFLLRTIDNMMWNQDIENLNNIFKDLQTNDLHLDLSIGILVFTLPVKSKLPDRTIFLDKLKEYVVVLPDYDESLLKGLD